jgi:hypothetical protein
VFINEFGYIAAGYTTLFCYFVQAMIDYIAMKKIVGQSIYNMKIIAAMSVGIVVISLFSNITYDYLIIRYVIAAAIVALGAIYRKKLMSLFVGMKKGNKSES